MEDKKNVRKGVCRNYGNCDKANTQEIIEIENGKPFECPECGEPLVAVGDTGDGPGGDDKIKKIVKYLIIAAVVVGIVVVLWYIFGYSRPTATETLKKQDSTVVVNEPQTTTDTILIEDPKTEDSTEVEEKPTVTEEQKEVTEKSQPDQPNPNPQPAQKTVLGGAATMTTSGGYTTIKFKRGYNLDMGDADHSSLSISAGDEIYMANVRNGYLYGGQLKYKNGEEKPLSGIKVRL